MMSDIFHGKVNMRFQPRALFKQGKDLQPVVIGLKCLGDGKYCLDMFADYPNGRVVADSDKGNPTSSQDKDPSHDIRAQV